MQVFRVTKINHYLGMRIEGYNIEIRLFAERAPALQAAFAAASKFNEEHLGRESESYIDDLQMRDDGQYIWDSDQYPGWPECHVSVTEEHLKLNDGDVVYSLDFNA